MVKQIEIFGPYDKEVQELLGKNRISNDRIKQTELCDLKDPEEAKLVSDLMYHCKKIDGKIGKDPLINYFYFKYHGTKEKFEKAEKDLNAFCDIQNELASKLEKELENSPPEIKNIKRTFYFLGVENYIEVSRN